MIKALIRIMFSAVALLCAVSLAGAEDSVEGKFLSNIRQVTSGFEKAGEGYFSPDGKTLVAGGFGTPGDGDNQLYVITLP